ncbi:right-handed parallel beta-helix repeat-containing protein [Lentzea sp. BCCO 10_0061]|uniref:Right-handed parallel beta-helix repeat-containing protein n=1 Tax=Lentzea sokolovensis TaxID=3095429 RepID=A0ABU4V7P7_9PSEU|nr:right-handed parallel beta-helix repeat-containing protein [Lentzea sp. BCCO 10_0061]MDX8147821.1 right-handed parallel beta-helix repeat-containing protein [Lentzea sp. BCCO 10_0061]
MRYVRAVVWGAVGLVGCGVLAAVGDREQHSVPEVRLQAGSAWVSSNRAGHLTLLDGASREVGVRVPVADPGTKLAVAQQNLTAYAVNRGTGALRRVDGATREVSAPESPLPGAAVSLYSSGDSLLLFDTGQGLLSTVDQQTLRSSGEPQVLSPAAKPDLTAVDRTGALWVVDDATGDLVWFREGRRESRANAGSPGATRIVATAGTVALLDLNRRMASVLNTEGEVAQEIEVPLQPGDEVAVSGLPGEPGVLVSVSNRGQFVACRFTSGCGGPRVLGTSALGPAVVTAEHTFVPDYGRGHVWVLRDGASDQLDRQIFDGQTQFELFERDGVVFYNDPESERAGVIGLDGQVHPISKYDPVDPARGTVKVPAENQPKPPPDEPQPPNPNQPANPSQPPATGRATLGSGVPQQDVLRIQQTPPNPVRAGARVDLSLAGAAAITASWNFGDGTTGTGTSTGHIWSRAGTFGVTVTATLASGRSASASATVVVQDVPAAIVRLQVSPAVPLTGAQVSFSAEVTGSPQTWQWSISSGGGVVGSSSEQGFGHVFTMPGTYTVTARTTTNGVVDEQSQQFEVGLPTRSFSCGDSITASVRLGNDVSCSDVALSVTSGDVYLDLGGHLLSNSDVSQDTLAVRDAANVTITNGTLGVFSLTNTDGVTLTGLRSRLPNMTNARDTHINGGKFDGFHRTRIISSQATFTNVDITNTMVALSCLGGSRCDFINSSLEILGPGAGLVCGDNPANAVTITGGKHSFEGLGCENLTIADAEVNGFSAGGEMLDIRRSTLRLFYGLRGGQIHIEENTFSGGSFAEIRNSGGPLSGVFRNNTVTGMGLIGVFVNINQPVSSLLIENNTITGNGGRSGTVSDRCGNEDAFGGMHVCAPAGSNITLRNNRMSDNRGRALLAMPATVKDGGGNTGGGETCQPAICS